MNINKISLLLASMLATILLSSLFLTVAFAAENPEETQYNREAANIVADTLGKGPIANGETGSLNVGLVVRSELFSIGTPSPTETPAPTANPPAASKSPTAAATTPPLDESPTQPANEPTSNAPATLAPPTPLPSSPAPQVLIPETGVMDDLTPGVHVWVIALMGIGLIGLGIAFYGIATHLKEK